MIATTLAVIAAAGSGSPTRLDDNSDWWSILNPNFVPWRIKAQNVDIAPSNFVIQGVALGEHMFTKAATELGQSTEVSRGDAAFGRSQVCYKSSESPVPTYLVFERGEVDLTFYLFRDGTAWTGSDRCLKLPLVSATIKTGSGLHLGQSRPQVELILGEASAVMPDRLMYFFEVRKTPRPDERQWSGQGFGKVKGESSHQAGVAYNLSVRIEARFIDSKLSYLMVSKAETD